MEEIRQKFTLEGAQHALRTLLNLSGLTEFELAHRARMHPSTLYNIFRPKSERGVRRSTMRKLAEAVGYRTSFEMEDGDEVLVLTHVGNERGASNQLRQLADEVSKVVLASGRADLSEQEFTKVVEMVRLLLAKN